MDPAKVSPLLKVLPLLRVLGCLFVAGRSYLCIPRRPTFMICFVSLGAQQQRVWGTPVGRSERSGSRVEPGRTGYTRKSPNRTSWENNMTLGFVIKKSIPDMLLRSFRRNTHLIPPDSWRTSS